MSVLFSAEELTAISRHLILGQKQRQGLSNWIKCLGTTETTQKSI